MAGNVGRLYMNVEMWPEPGAIKGTRRFEIGFPAWACLHGKTKNTSWAGGTTDGKYHKGKAAKWRFSGQLMEMLAGGIVENQDLREREDEDVVGAGYEATANNKGRERHPLWEQKIHKWALSLVQLPKEKTMRPVLRTTKAIYRWDPDEITRFVEPFVALAA